MRIFARILCINKCSFHLFDNHSEGMLCVCVRACAGLGFFLGRDHLLKMLNMFLFLDDLFIGLEMFLP